jgi:hypothetical protein
VPATHGEIWAPEPQWLGRTVFLLGGGPSLRDFKVQRLKGKTVMAVNSSCHAAPWADILFFTDYNWMQAHLDIVKAWKGLVVTPSSHAKTVLGDRIRRIQLVNRPDFSRPGELTLKFGRSSGHTAISLAVALGAARIVLLGYDMRRVDGRSHHHDDYLNTTDALYERDFIPWFKGWNEAAQARGIEILNATPGSALLEFPLVSIEDVLRSEDRETSAPVVRSQEDSHA